MIKSIGLAYPEWEAYFRSFIPELKLFQVGDNIHDYKLMIFPGGADVNPAIYKEKNTSSFISVIRDTTELNILHQCINAGIKIFGICRGHQLINAATGGKLIQDLHHEDTHEISWMQDHDVRSFFPNYVNSMHHQGYSIPKISPDLTAIAVEPTTGVVEVATDFKNILTVQFHPESMGSKSIKFFDWLTNVWTT